MMVWKFLHCMNLIETNLTETHFRCYLPSKVYMLGLRRTPENPRLQQLAYTCLEIFREGICENRCLQSIKVEDILALNIFEQRSRTEHGRCSLPHGRIDHLYSVHTGP